MNGQVEYRNNREQESGIERERDKKRDREREPCYVFHSRKYISKIPGGLQNRSPWLLPSLMGIRHHILKNIRIFSSMCEYVLIVWIKWTRNYKFNVFFTSIFVIIFNLWMFLPMLHLASYEMKWTIFLIIKCAISLSLFFSLDINDYNFIIGATDKQISTQKLSTNVKWMSKVRKKTDQPIKFRWNSNIWLITF